MQTPEHRRGPQERPVTGSTPLAQALHKHVQAQSALGDGLERLCGALARGDLAAIQTGCRDVLALCDQTLESQARFERHLADVAGGRVDGDLATTVREAIERATSAEDRASLQRLSEALEAEIVRVVALRDRADDLISGLYALTHETITSLRQIAERDAGYATGGASRPLTSLHRLIDQSA